jgi:prepilin-type processing-associated H-X9-DG protein
MVRQQDADRLRTQRVPGDTAVCQPRRVGFTVLEVLTVISIVSLSAAIALPAVGAAREAARRIQCVNQLKQVGLALQSYHETCGSLPAGCQWEATNRSGYGWAVPLLPYLEHGAIYDQTDRNVLLTDAANGRSRETSIGILLCPSDITEPRFTLFWEDEYSGQSGPLVELPTANYFGVFGTFEPDEDDLPNPPPGDGTFIDSRPIRLEDLMRGTSNTIIVGERTMARIPGTWLGVDWQGEDAPCRLVGAALTSPNCEQCEECEFDSRHPGGANFLWGDGRVSLVSEGIDSHQYQTISRRSDF